MEGNWMDARKLAQALLNEVIHYCENKRNPGAGYEHPLECISRYGSDGLLEFINSHLTDKYKNIKETIRNADQNLLSSVKREYTKLWKEEIARELGTLLRDEMYGLYENIVQNDELDDRSKARRLKAYEKVLEEFANAVNRALKEKKPLSERELLDWFDKMGDVTFGIKNYNYYEIMGHYIGFYDLLNDTDKLKVLETLLDLIGNTLLYDIDEKLSELGTLTNTR